MQMNVRQRLQPAIPGLTYLFRDVRHKTFEKRSADGLEAVDIVVLGQYQISKKTYIEQIPSLILAGLTTVEVEKSVVFQMRVFGQVSKNERDFPRDFRCQIRVDGLADRVGVAKIFPRKGFAHGCRRRILEGGFGVSIQNIVRKNIEDVGVCRIDCVPIKRLVFAPDQDSSEKAESA